MTIICYYTDVDLYSNKLRDPFERIYIFTTVRPRFDVTPRAPRYTHAALYYYYDVVS